MSRGALRADGRIAVDVVARTAEQLPATSGFSSVDEASAFFEGGSLGYSVTSSGKRLDGVVLKTEEGAFPLLVMPFYFFAGGPILPGTQWFAWIHVDDAVGLLMMALEDQRVRGPLNATAPEPQTNREFVKTIARVMGRPAWMPVPGFAMKLMLGEMADMITTGQRVIPQKAQELGYQFKYPTSQQAIRSIIGSYS